MYKMAENTVGYAAAVATTMLIEEWEKKENKRTRKTIAGVTYNQWCKTKWKRFVSKLSVMNLLVFVDLHRRCWLSELSACVRSISNFNVVTMHI